MISPVLRCSSAGHSRSRPKDGSIVLCAALSTGCRVAEYRLLCSCRWLHCSRTLFAAEEVAPENLTLLLQTGECLAILKRYEEAFARFFKVEYLDTNSNRATRAIAWCSFLTAKDEQAQRYYDRLLQQDKVRHEDYINAAHVQWIAGNRSKAVELYKKAASMCSKEQFEQQMKHDKKILIERGASQFELMLLREIIE